MFESKSKVPCILGNARSMCGLRMIGSEFREMRTRRELICRREIISEQTCVSRLARHFIAYDAWALKDSTKLFHTFLHPVLSHTTTQHTGRVECFASFQAPDSIRFAHGVTTSSSMAPHACIILNRLAKGSDFPRQGALGKARFHVIISRVRYSSYRSGAPRGSDP